MPRSTGYNLEKIYKYIKANPGCTPCDLLKYIGSRSRTADPILISLEIKGYLISEDSRGHLYVFTWSWDDL
jgi:predicted transcriptional regulator